MRRRNQRWHTIRRNRFHTLVAVTILRLHLAAIFYQHHAKNVGWHTFYRVVGKHSKPARGPAHIHDSVKIQSRLPNQLEGPVHLKPHAHVNGDNRASTRLEDAREFLHATPTHISRNMFHHADRERAILRITLERNHRHVATQKLDARAPDELFAYAVTFI